LRQFPLQPRAGSVVQGDSVVRGQCSVAVANARVIGHAASGFKHSLVGVAVKREIRPQRCAKEAHTFDDHGAIVQHVNMRRAIRLPQRRPFDLHVGQIVLVIAGNVDDWTRKVARRPRNALTPIVNIAGEDDDTLLLGCRRHPGIVL